MAFNDHQPTTVQVITQVFDSVPRGAAIAFLALALYAALTNWNGGGDVWALRYAVLAITLPLAGQGLRKFPTRSG